MPETPSRPEKAAGRKAPTGRSARAKRALEDDLPAKKPKVDAKAASKVATQEAEDEIPAAVNLKGIMTKDLQVMMYGYGDDVDPLPETVDLVEDIVLDYTTKLLRAALDGAAGRAKARGGSKVAAVPLGPEDIMYLVRRDARKFARVRELLVLQEEIKKAKSIVDTSPEEIARLA